MADELSTEDIQEAHFVGDKIAKGLGGYIFQYFVPYDHADAMRALMGGAWQPDSPVRVGIARLKETAVKADAP